MKTSAPGTYRPSRATSRVVSLGALTGARFVLLVGPAVLAFFSGGYFDAPRAWAGLIVWVLVAISVLAGAEALPRGRGPLLGIAGLGLLAAWTLLSMVWAPIRGSAFHAGQLVVLYAGALIAAAILLRDPRALRATEPALAAGCLFVVGYGLSERLLPGLLSFQRSVSAAGRLEQPLTYWNAMGEVAALGIVLCARLAGDANRPLRLRMAAAAGSAPLGLGIYTSFSRGALFACLAGLVTLLVAAPRREQLHGALVCLAAATLASAAGAPFRGLTALAGGRATRELQGAVVLALLMLIAAAAGLAVRELSGRVRTGPLHLPRLAPLMALVAICGGLAIALVVSAKEPSGLPASAGATHLVTLQSNRYAYWRVAMRAFSDEPLRGVGAGGWGVYWLRLRPVDEFDRDAHSLPIQTLAELGLVGFGLLLSFLGGVALAARDAHRGAPALAAGPIAGFVVWVAHAPLDWDWQLPAVTLFALVLAGALLALASASRSAESGDLADVIKTNSLAAVDSVTGSPVS